MTCPHTRIAVLPYIRENPYQRLLYAALEDHGFEGGDGELKLRWLARHRRTVSVIHFHWPQGWYRDAGQPGGPLTWIKLALFAIRLAGARALGYRVVWTVHEVYPLNPARLWVDRLGSRILAHASNVLLANDRQTADRARSELGHVADEIAVVPHPAYVGAYPAGRSREEVRARLGIGASTFVFILFGHVTAYKRVDTYVDAFRAAGLDDTAIIVAGLVQDEPSADRVRAAAAKDPRIKPLLQFIPEDRVAELFGAADAAIAPRQDGGTSGALVLAMSMGVPVLAADVPTYSELTDGSSAAWLFPPGDRPGLIAAMRSAASDREGAEAKGRRGEDLVSGASWDQMAEAIGGLLRTALGDSRARPVSQVAAQDTV